MAGQVAKLTFETAIKGFEEVQGLGKALKQINVVAGKSDKQFLSVAKRIKEFANANNNSVNAIRGQITALEKLRNSANAGGRAYKSLTKDISNLNTQLITLSNVEKVAQESAARDSQGRLLSDRRVAGRRSPAVVKQGLFTTKTGEIFANQLVDFNNTLKDLQIGQADYNAVLKNLIENTRVYNNTLNNQQSIQSNINATERVKAASRSQFNIGTSSQGYNPYTATGRSSVEGQPVQGPFALGPKRTEYLKKPVALRTFEAFMESTFPKGRHTEFRGALNEPLVSPIPLGPGGAGVQYGGKGPVDLEMPKTFAKSMKGFDDQISSYSEILQDLNINSDERVTIGNKIKKLEEEKQGLLKAENEKLKAATKKPFRKDIRAAAGSKAAQGLSIGADGTFIGLPGKSTLAFAGGQFKAPEVKKVAKSVKQLTNEFEKNTKAGKTNINTLTKQRNRLESIRNGLDPTSAAFKRATQAIQQTDKALQKLNANKFSGANLRRTGQSILGAGFVGGPAGFLGAGVGAGIEALRPGGDMAGGAITGGLVASQVLTPISQAIGGATTYSSDIEKANIALKGITKTTENYDVAQAAITKAVELYNVPQEVAIKGMTRLSAAVLGAGGNVHNAAEAFLNTTVAIKGTAGSADDVKSAITAMVQIYSKGKVSAEELSGQLGERFPAAVTKFAKANNISTQELQKSLKDGTVGLDMLSKFVKSLGDEYAPLAEKIAASSEEAGARAQISMNKLKIAVGTTLKPIGAEFQEIGAELLLSLIPALKSLAEIGAGAFKALAAVLRPIAKQLDNLMDAIVLLAGASGFYALGLAVQAVASGAAFGLFMEVLKKTKVLLRNMRFEMMKHPKMLLAFGASLAAFKIYKDSVRWDNYFEDLEDGTIPLNEAMKDLKNAEKILKRWKDGDGMLEGVTQFKSVEEFERHVEKLRGTINKLNVDLDGQKHVFEGLKGTGEGVYEGLTGGINKFTDSVKNMGAEVANVTASWFDRMADSLANFVMTGKLKFKEFARSVIADIAKMIAKQMIFNMIAGFGQLFGGPLAADRKFSGLGAGSALNSSTLPKGANGLVVAKNGIVPYAKGGIVNSPTLFPFSRGVGLMGEAGPESVMPLKRGSDGKLGVIAHGGGGATTVNVSVDAKGTKVEGDGKQMAQLGRMLGSAIEAELVKQKRPGGLLA